MTTNSNEKEEKVTMGDHVADTHRNQPVVGQVVTGDIVGGEVRKDEETGDDTES
jgi:hypothetical protein